MTATRTRQSLLCALALTGCVTDPFTGAEFQDEMRFSGFASSPDAQISVEVFRKSTSTWVPRDTFTPDSIPTTIAGDTLYFWGGKVQMIPPGEERGCYVHADCGAGSGTVLARALQDDPAYQLVTFDSDGVACVSEKIASGQTWLNAGSACQAETSPVLHLEYLATETDCKNQIDDDDDGFTDCGDPDCAGSCTEGILFLQDTPSPSENWFSLYDVSNDAIVMSVHTNDGVDALITPISLQPNVDGESFWIAGVGGPQLLEYVSGSVVGQVPHDYGGGPFFPYGRDLVMAPDGSTLYVAGYDNVAVIDPSDLSLVATIDFQAASWSPGNAIAPDGAEFVQIAYDGSAPQLVFVDTSSHMITQELQITDGERDVLHRGDRVVTWDALNEVIRGYVSSNGQWQLDPSLTASTANWGGLTSVNNLEYDAVGDRAFVPLGGEVAGYHLPTASTQSFAQPAHHLLIDEDGLGVLAARFEVGYPTFEHLDLTTGLTTDPGFDLTGLTSYGFVIDMHRVYFHAP